MAEPTGARDIHAATLAAAFLTRLAMLESATRETAAAVERDRADLEERYEHSALADDLIGAVRSRLESAVRDCEALIETLERFRAVAGPPDAVNPVAPAAPLGKSPGIGPSAQADEGDAGSAQVSEGVRLLATQMSVAGASIDEMVRQLRDDFGVKDAESVVWEIFGNPGDEGASRAPTGGPPPGA